MGLKDKPPFNHMDFGFEWGAAQVTRLLSDKGGVLLGVETPRGSLQLWVTKTGKVTVYGKGFVRMVRK